MSEQKALNAVGEPDHSEFNGELVGWDTVSPEGWAARLDIIQPGFNGVREVSVSGERIWLYEPTGVQRLEVSVLDEKGRRTATYHLSGEGAMADVPGGYHGRNIRLATPTDQGPIRYMRDYPGRLPGASSS